jgi:hypothetical protein
VSRGDHLFVRRRHYTHHGIDCGDGTVIHFGRKRSGAGRRIERVSREAFARGGEVRVKPHRHRLPVEQILRNAESRLGETNYSLMRNNCEHIATWSVTGRPASKQVRNWAVAAPGAVFSFGFLDTMGLHLLLLGSVVGLLALRRPFRR